MIGAVLIEDGSKVLATAGITRNNGEAYDYVNGGFACKSADCKAEALATTLSWGLMFVAPKAPNLSKTTASVGTVGDVAIADGITQVYSRPSGATTPAQRASVQGKPCVDCGITTSRQVADHKDPLLKEYYRTGTIDLDRMRRLDSVQSQCPTCSARQGADMSRLSREIKAYLGIM
jgi:hypothetical protein